MLMKTLEVIDKKKYDLVIENGTVIFGSLKEKELLNIGIIGDKIEVISKEKLNGKKKLMLKTFMSLQDSLMSIAIQIFQGL